MHNLVASNLIKLRAKNAFTYGSTTTKMTPFSCVFVHTHANFGFDFITLPISKGQWTCAKITTHYANHKKTDIMVGEVLLTC